MVWYPSILFHLFVAELLRQQTQEGNPNIHLPSDTPQSVPRPEKKYNPSSKFWVPNLQREASKRHPNPMPEPSPLTAFDRAAAALRQDKAPHPVSKAKPGHPMEEAWMIITFDFQ